MRSLVVAVGMSIALSVAAPSSAQLGGKLGQLGDKLQKVKEKVDEFNITDADEQQLGAQVSGMLREKYGVVQDKAAHKYVTLVGTVLAQASSRPRLNWTFIVLDTDGVNAFAAPGGFVHITRGALALIQDEAELADVLGHEISHVTGKHAVNAIKKNKAIQVAADATKNAIVKQYADKTYEMLLENAYDRGDEMDADKNGVALANRVGYSPAGLGAFLTRLQARNKDLTDRSGLFASHPETKARVDGLAKVIAAEKLVATATVAARFHEAITFRPVPVAQVATGEAAAGSKPGDAKGSGGKFGLSGLNPLGKEKTGTQTVSSAGSRGVNPDRDARGGPNKGLVVVTVTASEVTEFRKGIV